MRVSTPATRRQRAVAMAAMSLQSAARDDVDDITVAAMAVELVDEVLACVEPSDIDSEMSGPRDAAAA